MHFIGRMRIPSTLCHMINDGRLSQFSDYAVRQAIPQLNGVNLKFTRHLGDLKRWGEAVLRNRQSDHDDCFGMFRQSLMNHKVKLPSLDIERSFLFGEGRNIGDDTFIALHYHAGFRFEPCIVTNSPGAICDWRIVASTFDDLAERLILWDAKQNTG